MLSYKPKFYLSLQVATSFFLLAWAAAPDQCNFVKSQTDSPVFGYKLYQSTSPLDAAANTCEKLCVKGVWAMYNKVNYGVGQEPSTLVWPVEGISETDCTSGNVNYVLKQIKCVKLLAEDAPETYFSLYKFNYFLSEIPDVQAAGFYEATDAASRVRSVAFYTSAGPSRITAVLCAVKSTATAPSTECYCYDYTAGPRFVVPEPKYFFSGGEEEMDCVSFLPSTELVCPASGKISRDVGCVAQAEATTPAEMVTTTNLAPVT